MGPRLPFPPVDAAFPHLTAFEWENSFCVIAVFQTPRTLHDTLPTCSTRRPIRGTRRPSQCRDLSLIDAPRWTGPYLRLGRDAQTVLLRGMTAVIWTPPFRKAE